jgi:hypothetical protein
MVALSLREKRIVSRSETTTMRALTLEFRVFTMRDSPLAAISAANLRHALPLPQ